MANIWIRIGFGLLVSPSIFAKASSVSYEAELVAFSRSRNLSEQRQWHRILLMTPNWVKSTRSLVDDDSFFFAKDGKTDPEAELKATLHAFFQSDNPSPRDPTLAFAPPNPHPQCTFPARFKWLNKQLQFDFSRMPKANCARMDELFADIDVKAISLVFSSSYVNNPGSLFGHTFIRIHRAPNPDGPSAAMLDHAISFAAYPDTSNALLYVLKGLGGGFPGHFDVLPYYMKVQEYNNHERRDLWEYELNLTRDQADLLVRSVFEINTHRIDYYYFDDNCGYLLLALMEIADPTLDLTSKLQTWVIPSDIIKIASISPGLIRGVDYRPSSYSRFLSRYRLLESHEVKKLVSLISENDPQKLPPLIATTPVKSRVKILDTALEYFDYKEKLSGVDNKPVLYADLRKPVLLARAETKMAPEPISQIPESGNPVLAHDTGRIGLLMGFSKVRGPLTRFEWRPALHDMANNTLGYSEGLEIGFMNTLIHYEWLNRKLRLTRLGIFEVFSLTPIRPLITPVSWRLVVSIDSENRCGQLDQCTVKHLEGGGGFAVNPVRNIPLMVYALAVADFGSSTEPGFGVYGAPGVQLGSIVSFSHYVKLTAQGTYFHRISSLKRDYWKISSDLVYSVNPKIELRTKVSRNRDMEYGVASYYFF